MRHLRLLIAAATVGALALSTVAVRTQVTSPDKAEVALRAAMEKESVAGDLKAAIEEYRTIAVTYARSNRAVAARALLRLAGCYEKLGREEARKTYQELISGYPDQQEEVKLAQTRLAALVPKTAAGSLIVTRQIWSGPEVDFSGRPSADGRYLSYSHPTGNVAIRELATEKTRRLTSDASLWTAEGWAGYSLFSPDGRQVVYEWGQWDSELRLVALDGSKPRVLLPAKRDWSILPCDWSSDGRSILIHYYRAAEREGSQMAVVTVADGSLRVVKTLDPRQPRNIRNMWFSPDGRYIVYDLLPPGARNERDLAIVSVDGALESTLVENPADDYVLGWSPDGRSIVFASDRSGAYGIWAIKVSNGRPDGEPRLLKRDAGPIRPLGFTRDGVLFYGQAGSMTVMDSDVYGASVDLDQGTMDEPRLAVQDHSGLSMFPDWSPDGRYLAYVSGRPDSKSYVLSIRDEKTGAQREIHPELARFDNIRWSPDGRSFLAQGRDKEQRGGLFLIDAQTGGIRSLLRGDQVDGAFFDAQWLPGGRRIVYATNSRRPEVISRIVVLDQETGDQEEILRLTDLRLIAFLALSPDGRTLAFAAARLAGGTDGGAPTSFALMTMPASGGAMTELLQVKFPEMITSLAWSRDSRSILFVRGSAGALDTERGQRWLLWQIPAGGGVSREIGSLPGLMQRGQLSLHPDGRRIAYTRVARRIEIWAMENLLASSAHEQRDR